MKTNSKKYRIVVLSDLKKSSVATLESTVEMAKMIGGEIEVFHVKRPTEVIDVENQLSAMRTINREHLAIDKKMQRLIKPISESCEINIKYSFTFGNIKNEIGDFIKENHPDIIVLGKKRSKSFGLNRDRISEFVLNNFNGVVLLTTENNAIALDNGISLGMLNNSTPFSNLEFAEGLMKHTKKPLKSFKIMKSSSVENKPAESVSAKTIEYVFEHSDGAIKNLSKYLSKNNINLLSIDRKQGDHEKQNLITPDIGNIIGKLDVAILVTGK